MEISHLRIGLKIFDKVSFQSYTIHSVDKHDDIIKITCLDSTNEIVAPFFFSIEEIEGRFDLVDTAKSFKSDPILVRQIAESIRIDHAYLHNPSFALEMSLIDVLPHQFEAVYDHLICTSPLRFLLADDAGAGKTIMAGLYIREMIHRHLITRILIVPPAGLTNNWESELRILFNLHFEKVKGPGCKETNPFSEHDRIIISIDTLRQQNVFERYKQANPFDLVIFDEAHKLSAGIEPDSTFKKTQRYELAENLVESIPNVLLLTATPHMGKDDRYFMLWRLLDMDLFSSIEFFNRMSRDEKKKYMLRRIKEELVTFENKALFPRRESKTTHYQLSQGEISEQTLYERVTRYCQQQYNLASISNRGATNLAMSVLQRRLTSSTLAILKTLKTRREKIVAIIAGLEEKRFDLNMLEKAQHELPSSLTIDEKTADEEIEIDGREESEIDEEQLASATASRKIEELKQEIAVLNDLISLATTVFEKGEESKFTRLVGVIKEYPGLKLIIFTEYKDTLYFLTERLEALGFTNKIACIHGGMDLKSRENQIEFFRDKAGAQYLIATDAAGEGINLQFCWLMINYDIPWNPARLEQRMGRIHRYKQVHDVLILNMVADGTREGRVLEVLLEKLHNIREELQTDKVYDIIGSEFREISLVDLIKAAIFQGKMDQAIEQINKTFEPRRVEEIIKKDKGRAGYDDIRKKLDELNAMKEKTTRMRLMPSFISSLFMKMLKYLNFDIRGDPKDVFSIQSSDAPLDEFFSRYPEEGTRNKFSFMKGNAVPTEGSRPRAIYLHPGEPFFEYVKNMFLKRFHDDGTGGAVFFDDNETKPYCFFLVKTPILKRGGRDTNVYHQDLFGLKVFFDGESLPCEPSLLLDVIPIEDEKVDHHISTDQLLAARIGAEKVARDRGSVLLERLRKDIIARIPTRVSQIQKAFSLRQADLLKQRVKLKENVEHEVPAAKTKLQACDLELDMLEQKKISVLNHVKSENDAIILGPITIDVQALILPLIYTTKGETPPIHRDDEAEKFAMHVVIEYETRRGAAVEDVSDPALNYHFDILSKRPDGEVRYIEVKGRSGIGMVELTEKEWLKAENDKGSYYLYVVFKCKTDKPLLCIRKDPFSNLDSVPRGGVLIESKEILEKSEQITDFP